MARQKKDPLSWYQWSPTQWQASRKVQRMNFAERGLYRELMDECWQKGGIPDSVEGVANLLAVEPEEVEFIWPRVRDCFELKDGLLVSPHIEALRTEADAYRVQQMRHGQKGGLARSKGSVSDPQGSPSKPQGLVSKPQGSLTNPTNSGSDPKPEQNRTEQNRTDPPPGAPCGETPPAGRGTRAIRLGEAGKLWPTGWSEAAEAELQALLAEYPKKRPDGTRMSNGSPKELRRLWLGILQANPQVTPRLLKLCAYEHLESEHHPGVRLEETDFVQLLTTLYGPKKASWEGYLEGALARQRAQDSGLNPEPIPLMRLAEAAHG